MKRDRQPSGQTPSAVQQIRQRLAAEQGTLWGKGRRQVALVYPSPYSVGMSSLGFQTVYQRLNSMADTAAERAFLPDAGQSSAGPLLTYESLRPVSDFSVIAFSVAYELEITGMFACLQQAGVPALSDERRPRDPWVIMGGPLTFSNPACLGPFADVVVMGEAEDLLEPLIAALYSGAPKSDVLQQLAAMDGFWVPSLHGDSVPPVVQCSDSQLPACSAIRTPHTELSDMFLIEPERGCSRGCTFCVMRRSTNGGMRWVAPQIVLDKVPQQAHKVGLVGAAVTDHPRIMTIVRELVNRGKQVSLSSLRADRLNDEFVQLLKQAGYRTLTIASDGASERLREGMEKRIREKHLLHTAELVRAAGIKTLKLYMMIGVPSETDDDLHELIDFSQRMQSVLGGATRMAMGIAPFVAKRNTPLDKMPFMGVREVERRLKLLRLALEPGMEIRPTSARWAWVEYCLAQGDSAAGLLAYQAWQAGGRFAHWKTAFAHIDANPKLSLLTLPSSKRRRLPVLAQAPLLGQS